MSRAWRAGVAPYGVRALRHAAYLRQKIFTFPISVTFVFERFVKVGRSSLAGRVGYGPTKKSVCPIGQHVLLVASDFFKSQVSVCPI